MAVSIGTVFMDLRASSKNLDKDIKKAMGGAAKSFAAAAKDISKVAAGYLSGRGLEGIFRKIADAASMGLESVDQLAKASDKLGTTTEALQGLRRAAELTGVASNTLDMGIQRMTRRISEAAQGTGEAANALKELGLDALYLNQLAPDQQFRAIADAMQGVGNQADKVRLSMRLFDSEGVALVNTLKLGREGLDDVQKELYDFGIAISRVDAAKVEAANDAFMRIKSIITGISQRIAVELAPFLETVTNRILASAKASDALNLGMEKTRDIFFGIAEAAMNTWQVIEGAFGGYKMVVSSMIIAISKTVEAVMKTVMTIPEQIIHVFTKFFEFIVDGFAKMASSIGESIKVVMTQLQIMASVLGIDVGKGFDKFEGHIDSAIAKIQEFKKEVQKQGMRTSVELSNAWAEAIGGMPEALVEEAKRSLEEGSDLLAKNLYGEWRGKEYVDKFRRDLKDMTDAKTDAIEQAMKLRDQETKQMELQAERQKELFKEVEEAAERRAQKIRDVWSIGFRSMSDEIDNFVDNGKFSFKGMVDSFIKDMIRMQLKSAVYGFFTGMFPKLANGGGVGGSAANAGAGFRSMMGFAEGGSPPVGKPSIVGENGPEIIVPRVPSTVIPNGASMGGTNVNLTFNFAGGVTNAEVESTLKRWTPRIIEASKNAVANAYQRGGGFKAAFST